jgi:hypothetical protein
MLQAGRSQFRWIPVLEDGNLYTAACRSGKLLLVLSSTVILVLESHQTYDHILLSGGSGSLRLTLLRFTYRSEIPKLSSPFLLTRVNVSFLFKCHFCVKFPHPFFVLYLTTVEVTGLHSVGFLL